MIATTYPQETHRPHRWGRRAASFAYDRPAEVLAVLQHARSLVETGWVQNRWTATAPPQTTATRPGSSVAVQGTEDGTVSACVVAAVALAVRARAPRAPHAHAPRPAIAPH